MKETFYFSHDYHAREDMKIIRLLQNEKWQWYWIFWAIVEMLYENNWYIEKDYESIAFALRTDCEIIQRIIEDYWLFILAWKMFTSKSVEHRLRQRKGKSELARQSAKKRWDREKVDNANAMRTQCERNAIKESKGKERKDIESYTTSIENAPEKKLTPNDIAQKFFATDPEKILSSLSVEPANREVVLREIIKFISYWTEPNKSGTRQLWQTKPTFEVSRRLRTWFDRAWNKSVTFTSYQKSHANFD